MKNMSDKFWIGYDPKPSGPYTTGYWYAYAEPGYDASGPTAESAMAGLIVALSDALTELDEKFEKAKS